MSALFKLPALPVLPRPAAMAKGLLLLAAMLVGLMFAFPSFAVDVGTGTVGGPLAEALTTLNSMTDGVKAMIGFIGFVVALISLASLRNMGPVLFFLGLLVFGAVGLAVATSIMGAPVAGLALIA